MRREIRLVSCCIATTILPTTRPSMRHAAWNACSCNLSIGFLSDCSCVFAVVIVVAFKDRADAGKRNLLGEFLVAIDRGCMTSVPRRVIDR